LTLLRQLLLTLLRQLLLTLLRQLLLTLLRQLLLTLLRQLLLTLLRQFFFVSLLTLDSNCYLLEMKSKRYRTSDNKYWRNYNKNCLFHITKEV
ncbi:MAG TPA: hypothetical protein VJ697_14360, partial [Nitrososphaeraceae archaeon]|nr:hypothetical protein [Nitrososphaeraceae archaeon]